MLDFFPEVLRTDEVLKVGLLGAIGVSLLASSRFILSLVQSLFNRLVPIQVVEFYQEIIQPYQNVLGVLSGLAIAEIISSSIPENRWTALIEISTSLSLIITASWLASRLFKRFFDIYLLEAAVKNGRKTNSELLILAKFLANLIIIVLAVFTYAQLHQINLLGLVASLGIGGLAVAFAAQKTLEQFLGGIVIYLDRPFVVDDYIGLPGGVFGRVESIGLRSTKIRTSGKGTLIIVPNSSLTQATIENFTGAKKVMALTYLNFHQVIPSEERALIRQIILESTQDIFGIDSQNTDVIFKDFSGHTKELRTQAQITFFILGSGEVSMDLRRQLLDLASQNITRKLKEYNVAFDIEEPTIYVDSPITI